MAVHQLMTFNVFKTMIMLPIECDANGVKHIMSIWNAGIIITYVDTKLYLYLGFVRQRDNCAQEKRFMHFKTFLTQSVTKIN